MKYREFYRLFDDLQRKMDEIREPGGTEAARKKIHEIMNVEAPEKHRLATQLFAVVRAYEADANNKTLSDEARAVAYLQSLSVGVPAHKAGLIWTDIEAEPEILNGEIAAAQGDIRGARSCFAGAVGQAPRSVNALVRNAMMDMLVCDYKNAKSRYEEALNVEPENPRLLTGKAVCLMEMDREEEAREILYKIGNHPSNYNYAPAYFFLSLIESDPSLREDFFNQATNYACMSTDKNRYMEPGTDIIIMSRCNYSLPEPQ